MKKKRAFLREHSGSDRSTVGSQSSAETSFSEQKMAGRSNSLQDSRSGTFMEFYAALDSVTDAEQRQRVAMSGGASGT